MGMVNNPTAATLGANAHDHGHGAGANSRQLSIALALTGAFLVAEVIGGLVFGSLALLSDAAHMFTDAAALAIALAAIRIGQRAADKQKTYGYRRFEILAAAFNAILLFAVAIYVLVEGVRRIFEPVHIQSTGMLIVATIGLIINIVSMRVLASGKERSLNVKGAYLEVWADMLGSIGVIVGAIVIRFTGWSWVDPIVAIAIGLWVLPRTWVLLRDTTAILLEGVPKGLSLAAVREVIQSSPNVAGVHDLHVWVTGADAAALSAHIELALEADAEATRSTLAERLEADFDIHHVTLQVEREPCADKDRLHL